MVIYMIFDGFVQKYVLLEKLACDATPPPEIGAQFKPRVGGIEPATFRLQAGVPPTRPNSGGQHGHTSSFAT